MKKRLLLYVFMLFAFLSGKAQVGHAFYVEPEGSVSLLNNIIIHNGDSNLNVVTPPYNLTTEDARVFMDAETNFILYYFSPAVDAGINSACNWLFDLADLLRIRDRAIDLGAYEFVNTQNYRQYAVHQMQSGHLYFCNNVIVNNPMHVAMTNVGEVANNNILSDSVPVFRDLQYDFSLYAASPAVNAGQNFCNQLPFDLQKKNRICEETIDIGAFEHEVVVIEMDSVFVVYQNEEGSLTLCNNIDINNSVYSGNTNVQGATAYNIFDDDDSLFVHNIENFMPRDSSRAIDAGLNSCNTLAKDLAKKDRVMGESIEIGAYEQSLSNSDTLEWQYVVHQQTTGELYLCNNIIVNNPAHVDVTNVADVSAHNILSDSVLVFCDIYFNFKPFEGSPAVDSGLNSCNAVSTDIDMLPRIAREVIDIGAFELPERNDTIVDGGDEPGGGGGGSDPSSPYYHTTVFHADEDTLFLCNNIIINNSVFIGNARPDADSVSNILVDQDTLFMDNKENFMPREHSIAVNRGENACNSLEFDLAKHQRVYEDTIDIGAYEQFVEETDLEFDQLVLHQLGEGHLTLCNNIIVNNPAHTELSNIEEIPENNILSDSLQLFLDPFYDFSLWLTSPAVNAGSNNCCTWSVDIACKPRICADTIDVGAFEYSPVVLSFDTIYTVMQDDTSELLLCNNILINNSGLSVNTNIENLPLNNIWQDNDSIFTDNRHNYLPLPQSIAVNAGSNDCNILMVDLAKRTRVMADTIEIGAYELFEEDTEEQVIAAVHQVDTTHQLRLYNNIIINNPWHTHNYAGSLVDAHNMLEDMPDVFVDITSDFSLMEHSPAIDTGANEWVSWRYDLKDDERISCANIVDLGAFEYSYDDVAIALTATEVLSDNCMGSYILLQATPGAQHYIWSHTNEDTCELAVLPLVSTSYTVVATNGGACRDTATIQIFPSSSLSDSSGTPSSIGKTFWLSYLRNHFREPELTVQLSAERACSGTVSNPRTSWSVPFTVGAHSVTTVTIPLEQAYPMDANAVGDFGILVEATDTISVYAANYNNNSFDVTVVLPVNALDDEYMVQTYVPTMNSEFVIVATEDNTEVEITPSKALMGGRAARQTYVITMQRGQTYLGISRFGGAMGDLSGSIIKARDGKRVAVFNGNVCAMVPTTNSYTDHLVEQAVGVKYWGRSFALTTTESQNFDMVRVTALRSNTVISKNGTAMATIQTGETYEFQLMGSEGSCFLETSQPAGVYLYIAGAVQGNDQELSDPSMIWIPPVEQKMNDLTFATFQSPGISDHYVNVVIPQEAMDEITMDGQLIGDEFSLMPANPQFAFVRKHILPGTHTLQCDQGFIAHVYGLGYHESYGYAAGSKAEALKEQLLVNDIPSANLPANQRFCPYEPIDFRVEVNYSCDSVLWNFGDSSNIVNAMSTTHAFTEAGSYAVSATLFLTSGEAVFCTNMYVRINVVEGFGAIYYDTICYGERYLLHGFDVEADEAGHFTHTRTVEMPGMYCDSTYVLELEVLNNVVRIEDTICEQNLYDQYGFTILATNVGLMTDTLHLGTSSSGCDSMRILKLLVTPNMEHIPEIIGEAYPCVGEVFSYSLDSLSSLQDVSWMVPDSVVIVAQPDDYHISLLFESSEESYEISVQGHNRCGDTILRKMIYPQPYSYVQLVDTICDNHRHYQHYGFDIADVPDTSDLYIHHDVSSAGCDSTTVLAIVIVPTYRVTDTIVVCETDLPYPYQDTLLAAEGTYTLGLLSQCGCDSVVDLTLLVNPSTYETIDETVHYYELPYELNGSLYDTCGVYTQTLQHVNSYGCDSVITLHLTVLYNITVQVDSIICQSELPLIWNGVTFNLDENPGAPVILTDTAILPLPIGVDSIVVMQVTVNPTTYGTVSFSVVENALPTNFNGTTYDSAGVYIQQLTNEQGCDSILTVELTVHKNVTNTVDSTICESDLPLIWDGVIFTAEGTHIDTLIAHTGADSVVVRILHVIDLPVITHTPDTAILGGDYATLRASGANLLTWTDSNGNPVGEGASVTVRPLTSGYYYVTAYSSGEIVNENLLLNADFEQGNTGFTSQYSYVDSLHPSVLGAGNYAITDDAYNVWSYRHQYGYGGEGLYMIVDGANQPNRSVWSQTVEVLPDTKYALSASFLSVGNFHLSTAQLQFKVNGEPVGNSIHLAADPNLWQDYMAVWNSNAATTATISLVDTNMLRQGNDFGVDNIRLTPILLCPSTDSIWVEVLPNPDTMLLSESACVHYVWYGDTLTQSGVYYHGMTNQLGYDSVEVLNLTILPLTYGLLDTTVVENDLPLRLNGMSYANDSTFTQILVGANANGCDSVLTVNLTVHYNNTYYMDTTVCDGDFPVTWNDVVFTTAGTQSVVHQDSYGADSIVVLTVNYNPTTYGTLDTAVLQDSLPLLINGSSYSLPDIYTQHLTNAAGCDSILTINMTVIYNVVAFADSVVCAINTPFEWNGITFTQTTTRVAHLIASTGADSTLIMRVTVIYTTYGTLDTTVLENDLPFVWNEDSLNTPGYYNQYLYNYAGCDSILTIHLRVLYNKRVVEDSVLCETELLLEWNGVVFDIADIEPLDNALLLVDSITTYASTGADSTVVMMVYVNPTTYGTLDTAVFENALPLWLNGLPYSSDSTFTQTFVGANANGCDSVLTVNLTVLYNVTTAIYDTICENQLPFVWNGVNFDVAGTQDTVLTASTGVDSMVVMTLHVNPITYGILDTIVLEDDLPLSLNGFSYMTDSVFTQTIFAANVNGCDSVLTVNMTVLYNVTTSLYDTICENQLPFVWNGVQFDVAGTQDTVLTASTGVDSTVVMTLYVNPITYGILDTTVLENDLPLILNGYSYMTDSIFTQTLPAANANGCDSVLTVNMMVLYNLTTNLYDTICENQLPMVWNGIQFDAAGTQDTVMTASTGVDSTVVMTLYVNPITYGTLDTIVLENDLPLMLNGFSYMTDSVFTQTISAANVNGCDSVLTVNMMVLYNVTTSLYDTICENQLPFVWNGVRFETSGTQDTILSASTGVDSTVVMTLYVNPMTYGTLDTTVLENDLPLMLNGFSYMSDSVFTQTLPAANVNGCDSVLTVNMTVLYNLTTNLYDTICENQLPLVWNGIQFDAAGTQDTVLTASAGVDSTVVMTLYVNPITYGTLDTIVLENELPLSLNGFSYRIDSIFTQTLPAANINGCDSVLTVNMTVLYNVMVEVDSVICDGELPFTWNGVTFAAEDIDSVISSAMDSVKLTASTGVDSTVMMTVHVHYANTGIDVQSACDSYTWIDGVTYTASTDSASYTLTNAAGCDSVVTLHLTVNHSVVSQDTLVLVENQLPYYFAVADTTIGNGAPAEFQFNYYLSTIHGCDSIIAQTVIIHYNTSATEDTLVCASSLPYTWHGHQFTQAGSYNDTVLNADGSDHVITYQLNVSAPAITIQSVMHITCYGDSTGGVGVLVSGGIQPYNCHWEDNSGTTVSSMAQLGNQPAGKYRLYALDVMGCMVVDSVSLQHLNDSMVAGVIASDRVVCYGSGVGGFTGTAASGGASSAYQWQISANGTDWTAAPTPNNAQNYTYPNTVTSSFSLRRAWVSQTCGTVYSNVVTVSVAPVYNDTLHENVCQGYPYQEYGFDITAEETAEPTVITRVHHLQSVHSCDSTVTLLLTVIPSALTTLTDESCQRVPYQANGFDLSAEELSTVGVHTFERVYTTSGCDSIVTLQLTIHPVYEFDFEDVVCEGSAYNLHGFDVTTVQTLGVSDVDMTQHLQSQNGCDSIVNLYLRVVDTSVAIVSLTPDFCDEYTAELSVETNMTDYLWNTGETSQTITVSHPGTYTVTATQDNCSVTSWYTIENCELNIYLPNAITPSISDGLNDYFCLHEKYLPMIEDFEIRIYTRWGELIYYSDDKNFKWSGVRNPHTGEILINNIYTYLINFTDNRGIPHQLTGSITVL